jgi:hypothetical protein
MEWSRRYPVFVDTVGSGSRGEKSQCWSVLGGVALSRRDSESADLQESSGATGWNRTSDTEFRNHTAIVMDRSLSCALVLHGPRFCAASVLGSVRACWAVVRRLVGIASAIKRLTEPPMC